jgi:hypothetical protein
MNKESNILLIFLIILSLTTFTRTLVYYIFHTGLINFGSKSKQEIDKVIDKVLVIFTTIRIILVTIILSMRGVQNDILTYVLAFLFLSSTQRYIYEYTKFNYPSSNLYKALENFQDLNTNLVLLSSLYIMKYVFF